MKKRNCMIEEYKKRQDGSFTELVENPAKRTKPMSLCLARVSPCTTVMLRLIHWYLGFLSVQICIHYVFYLLTVTSCDHSV
ncbi:hypothetical protein XELAEV_18022784mg [Xenopus laevis]|uniref:Uncharacterized protein n=1 Tax=Xenopus laevis TaxID=8355 RepID=A0A974HP29_XENLA|nr:hypothetical protein XELAEV_18022784mg [Xenopus laevis]